MSNTSEIETEQARIKRLIQWAEAARHAISDEEDAALTAAALADPDNPPADEFFRRKLGRPFKLNPKQAVKLRLDADVLEHFRAGGQGWQTRMNEALRKAAGL